MKKSRAIDGRVDFIFRKEYLMGDGVE
jgi:hypothetical protein